MIAANDNVSVRTIKKMVVTSAFGSEVVSIRTTRRPESEILIDREDAPQVLKHQWTIVERRRSHTLYAVAEIGGKQTYLHRFIMGAGKGHTTGSGLDNRKSKLEFTTHSENMLHAYTLPGRYGGLARATHVNKVRKKLASGMVRVYLYDRRSGTLLDSYDENKTALKAA
jgi:hypothetical protein